ncbi:MAG: hypothetical protein ACR2LN_07350 [Candidatus Levyibacteriota bacterium]
MSENDFVEIKENDDVLRVESLGAKVSLTLKGIPLLGSFTRGDGKTGITHPCTPVFGPDRKNLYGLKQHGNMRNEPVSLQHVADNVIVSHALADPGYPKGVVVKQIMGVEDGSFSLVMIHTNNGTEEVALNAGEHCYFVAPQGYKGTEINGKDISSLIDEHYDGFAIELEETNKIQIPGQPELVLRQNGFHYAMLWVGKNPDTKEIDQTYVCIEPVEGDPTSNFFGSTASKLLSGQSRSAMFSISL